MSSVYSLCEWRPSALITWLQASRAAAPVGCGTEDTAAQSLWLGPNPSTHSVQVSPLVRVTLEEDIQEAKKD